VRGPRQQQASVWAGRRPFPPTSRRLAPPSSGDGYRFAGRVVPLWLALILAAGGAAGCASRTINVNSGCVAFQITFSIARHTLRTQSTCDNGFAPIYTITLHPGQTMTAKRSTAPARYIPGWLPHSDEPAVLATSHPPSDHSVARYTALAPGSARLLLSGGCAGLNPGNIQRHTSRECVVLRVKVAGH
jgi:hypothetical protein